MRAQLCKVLDFNPSMARHYSETGLKMDGAQFVREKTTEPEFDCAPLLSGYGATTRSVVKYQRMLESSDVVECVQRVQYK